MMITSKLLLLEKNRLDRKNTNGRFCSHMSKPDFFIVSGTLNDNITLVNGE
jgi:hypothetical protein